MCTVLRVLSSLSSWLRNLDEGELAVKNAVKLEWVNSFESAKKNRSGNIQYTKKTAYCRPIFLMVSTKLCGEFHFIHSFAGVPVEEGLTTEHGSELLRNALEHLLDGSVIANKGRRHLEALGRNVTLTSLFWRKQPEKKEGKGGGEENEIKKKPVKNKRKKTNPEEETTTAASFFHSFLEAKGWKILDGILRAFGFQKYLALQICGSKQRTWCCWESTRRNSWSSCFARWASAHQPLWWTYVHGTWQKQSGNDRGSCTQLLVFGGCVKTIL